MKRRGSHTWAILFLLLFAEKAGLRLLIHNELHTFSAACAQKKSRDIPVLFKGSCDCPDDFFLPFCGPDAIAVDPFIASAVDRFNAFFTGVIPEFPFHAVRLRGPPVS